MTYKHAPMFDHSAASYLCPCCRGRTTLVGDTKYFTDHATRQRQCSSCGLAFNTIELDWDQYERLTGLRAHIRKDEVTNEQKSKGAGGGDPESAVPGGLGGGC